MDSRARNLSATDSSVSTSKSESGEKKGQHTSASPDDTRHSTSTRKDSAVHDSSSENGQQEDDAPDGGYGWVIAVASFLINTFSWGINSSFGVFLNIFLETDKFHGATPIQFAFVGGITFGIGLILAPFITSIVKLIGVRPTLIIGTTFQCLGLVAASFSTEYYQLFLSQGVLQGIGLGMVFFPPSAIIPQWFNKKRAFATGISTCGTGMGGIIFSLSVQRMVTYMSIEWIQRICGLMCFAVCVVCAMLIKSRDDVVHPKMDILDKEAFNKLEVWTMLAWGCLTMMGYSIFLFSMSNYSTSIGLTSQQGAAVGAILNAGIVIGRPGLGVVMDRFGRFNVTIISCIIATILCLAMWIPCQNYATAIALALIAGTQVCSTTVAIPPLCAELVGLMHLPPLLAASWMVMGISTVFGEPIVQALADDSMSKPYLYCQIFTALCFSVGALFLLFSRQRRVLTVFKERIHQRQLESSETDIEDSDDSDRIPSFGRRLFYWMKV